MSPLMVRRYRAERLLRQQFETLRARVLSVVRRRLRASGVSLDDADLEACYAQAWQGLYMATLAGQEISNPAGWLVTVTFRRAIEEHRARSRLGWAQRAGRGDAGRNGRPEAEAARERDVAAELDDRARLRQLFEALRGRLSAREREAAVLCYLQGLPRSEAAARMGMSEARMRKLMEGRGAGKPGVAGKVGALLQTVRGGGWCEEQASLMRGLAYGMLDPEGERYQLALAHGRECPACRAYVVSLRGLAAALPPVLVGPALGAATLGGVVAGSGVGGGMPLGQVGVVSASGAAGAGGGAAGGSWLLAGPLGAKFAVACLLALGLGAGCIVLETGSSRGSGRQQVRAARREVDPRVDAGGLAAGYPLAGGASPRAAFEPPPRSPAPFALLTRPSAATREFGPESSPVSGSHLPGSSSGAPPAAARATSSSLRSPLPAAIAGPAGGSPITAGTAAPRSTGAVEREFGPG